jgi:glycine cleavage system transcriptional repressor
MEEYLVVTAVGRDRPGIVAELTARLAERGASVADSRMAVLGGEFALMALVAAPPEQLEALQRDVRGVADELDLQLVVRPTRSPAAHRAGHVRSYAVEVHALDHPGIVSAVADALRGLGGNIVSLETTAYQASMTGAPLFRMRVTADFPAAVTAARLRETLSRVSDAASADVEVRQA